MSARAHAGPLFKAFSRTGTPLAGGKVWAFAAGTSSPKATFQDPAGTAAHTHPIVLDSAGEAAVFWGTGLYKVRVEDAAGVLQWEVDGFDPQVIDLPAPAVNLVSNGSFEADTDGDGVPDGWSLIPYAGGTADTERYNADTNPAPEVIHGEAALRFVSPGGAGMGGGYADQADFFEVSPSEDIDVTFWIRASAAGVHNKVDILWFTPAKSALGTPQTTVYDEATANPTTWTEKRYRVTPPGGATYARLRLYGCIDDDTTAGTTRFDHVTARAVQPEYLRSDGADTVNGALTFAASPKLANAVPLTGGNTSGTPFAVAQVDGTNRVLVGDPALNLALRGLDPTVSYNGNGLWHSSNDGAGSGLDADLLDGAQGADYARRDAAATQQFAGNLAVDNTAPSVALQETDAAGGNRNWVIDASGGQLRGRVADDGYTAHQNWLEVDRTGNTVDVINLVAAELRANGGPLWHAGNDGAGSGLDADRLDGLEGAAYGRLIQEVTGRNASPVTVVDGLTTLVDLTVGPVAVGQRIVVNGYMKMTKGGTAGSSFLTAAPLGSPVACMYGPFDTVANILGTSTYQPAGETHPVSVAGIFRVTDTQAAFTFRLTGASAGSDGSVGADDAGLLVRVING